MLIVGLTGGIATGKSTVSKLLVARGHEVVDTDKISCALQTSGSDALKEIVKAFGPTILNKDDSLKRKQLAQIIFSDVQARKQLDSIMHPKIMVEVKNRIQKSQEALLFIDVPLLFEAGFDKLTNLNVVVYTSPGEQLRRLMSRNKIDASVAHGKINGQPSMDEKVRQADFVIDNNGTLEQLEINLNHVLERITLRV